MILSRFNVPEVTTQLNSVPQPRYKPELPTPPRALGSNIRKMNSSPSCGGSVSSMRSSVVPVPTSRINTSSKPILSDSDMKLRISLRSTLELLTETMAALDLQEQISNDRGSLIENLQTELAKLTKECEELNKTQFNQEIKIANLETSNKELSSQLSIKDSELTTSKADCENLKDNLADVQAELDSLYVDYTAIQQNRIRNKSISDQNNEESDSQDEEKRQMQIEIEELRGEIVELNVDRQKLYDSVCEHHQALEKVHTELEAKIAANAQNSATTRDLITTVKGLSKQVETLEGEKKNWESEKSRLIAEIDDLNMLRNDMEIIEAEIDSLRYTNQEQCETIYGLRKELGETKS